MDIAVIEEVIFFGAGGDAAALSVGGELGNAVEFPRITFVISHGGPDGGVFEDFGEDVEQASLVFGICPGVVGVVSEHEPEVGGGVSGELEVGFFDIPNALTRLAGVAEDPNTGFGGGSGEWGRGEELLEVAGGCGGVVRGDLGEVFGGRCEAGEGEGLVAGFATIDFLEEPNRSNFIIYSLQDSLANAEVSSLCGEGGGSLAGPVSWSKPAQSMSRQWGEAKYWRRQLGAR